jgi:ELWxxDGT repeat protein
MSSRRALVAALLLVLLVPAGASADRLTVRGTKVFTSVAPDSQTQYGSEFAVFNGFLYFVADDDVHGNELWRTDGTDAGTTLVSDIHPGLPSASSNPHRFTVVGTRMYFNAYNATTQSPETVYYLDAAAPTTVKLAKAVPVGGGAAITAIGSLMGAPNGRAIISRLAEGNGYYAVYAVAPGSDTFTKISAGQESIGSTNVFSPTATAGGWMYYARNNSNVFPGQGGELWRTNGTTTEMVADIRPGNEGSSPSAFVATSDKVYFTADDGTRGRELWVTDPADKANTHVVYEHVPGPGATSINDPGQVANGSILYYVPANDPVTGPEVWRTDGTQAGTRVVKDITPGTGGVSVPVPFALRGGLGILRGSDVFASLDGTAAATTLLGTADLDGYGPNTPVVLGERAYFAAGFTPFGQALWRTDGTPAGTTALSAGGFDGTGATSGNAMSQTLAVLGSKLVFFSRDPSTNSTGAVKLYVIDTTQPDELRQVVAAPSISGSAAVGGLLTGSAGTWTRENRFTYQWLRNGAPVPNVTGTTYRVGTADVGAQLTFRVTAVGIGPPNTLSADSAPVTGVAAPPSGGGTPPSRTPSRTTPPRTPTTPTRPALRVRSKGKLLGTARVGATLRLRLPKFDRTGVRLTFRWSADGRTIRRRTTSTLKLTRAQQGKKVRVAITAAKSGFRPVTVTLGPTAKVKRARRR